MNVPSSFRINDPFGFTRLKRNSAPALHLGLDLPGGLILITI